LANWDLVTLKKEYGGLSIPNIREMNMALLASWIRRYNMDGDKLWKQIVDFKYDTRNPNIFTCSTLDVSPFWKGVMWAANAARLGYKWKIGDGRMIMFWEDQWLGSTSLAIIFWEIYYICNQQRATVRDIWDGLELKLTFRRNFSPAMMEQWLQVEQIAKSIKYDGVEDAMVWESFTVLECIPHNIYMLSLILGGYSGVHTCCLEFICAS
jgi:hypothetical protein